VKLGQLDPLGVEGEAVGRCDGARPAGDVIAWWRRHLIQRREMRPSGQGGE
jgi:hypothetical protein